jgi:hypothetical protein
MLLLETQHACSSQTQLTSHSKEIIMAGRFWLFGSAAVMACAAMMASANAGPVGTNALLGAGMIGSNVENVATRVCWRENGVRRCRSVDNVYGYRSLRRGNGYRDQIDTDPDDFPVGSSDWWRAMDALDRGGQSNGHQ